MSVSRPSPGSAQRVLGARARALNARAGAPPVPALYFFTDPQRTPDPLAAARALPRGAAIVYRPFGASDRLRVARALRTLARQRGLKLLIGDDERLAVRVDADGLHLPERHVSCIRAMCRAHPNWLVTVAAHSPRALAKAWRAGADAAVLSPVFPTPSHPGAVPLGVRRAGAWARMARLPIIALGGLNARSITQLRGPFAGLAAIGAFV